MNQDSKLSEFIENPNRSLWKLAIPMTLGLFMNSIYILVDTYFIGNIPNIGTNAISALGYVMPFYFVIMGITFGLSSGTTAVIAQYIGQKDKEKANETAHNSLLIAVSISIINILFVFFLGKKALMLQCMAPEVLDLAVQYFYVMGYGSIFLVFGIFLRAILIGEGESVAPVIALGTGTILNIILDPIFIYYLDWKIEGAAYATLVSQIIVICIFLYFFIIKQTTYIKLIFKKIKVNFLIWRKIFSIGFPSSISLLLMQKALKLQEAEREEQAKEVVGEVVAMLQAALRHGHVQPWMYEALSIALKVQGAPQAEMERVLMSAVDFSQDIESMMYIALYMSQIGLHERALQVLQDVSTLNPYRHEPYVRP